MKRSQFIILILLCSGIIFAQPTNAAPGDTLGEAIGVSLGSYSGEFTSYNEAFYYNFTGNPYQTYNFSISRDLSEDSDYPFKVYSDTGSQLASNSSLDQSKWLILSGYTNYSIRIFTTEFTITPDNFTLTLALHDTEPGKSLQNALIADLGTQSGNLTAYDDFDWYNFTANPNYIYNFTLSHSADTYYTLGIYDQETKLIDRNSDVSPSKYLLLSGESKFLIAVRANEFSTTPNPYQLTITEINPKQQTTTKLTSITVTTTTTETVQDGNETTGTGRFSQLPVQVLGSFTLVMVAAYMIRRRH